MDTVLLIVTGPRGSGKSTLMARTAAELRARGLAVAGVLCPGRYEAGIKTGTYWTDLSVREQGEHATGPDRLLAHADLSEAAAIAAFGKQARRDDPRPRPRFDSSDAESVRYGKWIFSKAALAAADKAGARALRGAGAVAFIDEIGPLELEHAAGFIGCLGELDRLFCRGVRPSPSGARSAGESALPKGRAVLVAVRDELAPGILERWPEGELVRLTESGRDALPAALAERIASIAR